MPEHQAPEIAYRCPVCMLKGLDPVLRFDAEAGELYCQGCCYTGDEAHVKEYYGLIRKRYRQLCDTVELKTI